MGHDARMLKLRVLAFTTVIARTIPADAAAAKFTDVPADHSLHEDITWLDTRTSPGWPIPG